MSTTQKQKSGFTIVELLIVIVVIGILAAITIVAYNGLQNRVKRSSVQSDVANFAKVIEVARLNTADGNYPLLPAASMGIKADKSAYLTNRNNWYYCVSTDRTQYALGVVTDGGTGGAGFITSPLTGLQERTGVDDASTCTVVSRPNGSNMGFNGTTSVWAGWVNG